MRATVYRNETLVANDVAATGEQVEWEQEWVEGSYGAGRPELTTTLGVARDRSSGASTVAPTAGVNFRVWPSAFWTVSGHLRYMATDRPLPPAAACRTRWQMKRVLSDGWVVGASLSMNQAGGGSRAAVGLARRWPRAATTSSPPCTCAGKAPGHQLLQRRPAGRQRRRRAEVAGVVFFDADRDGNQQSGEAGVPNVEVVLDGRFRTTTDRTGRFVFPLVGTGHHQITLTLETVPLPWGAASDRAVSVDVPLRGQANARIPVVRVGD